MGLQDAIFSQQSSQVGGFPQDTQKKAGPEELALALAGMGSNPQIAPFFSLGLGDTGAGVGAGAGTGGGAGGGNFLFPSAGGGGGVGGAGGGGLLGSLQGALSAYNLGSSAMSAGSKIGTGLGNIYDYLFGQTTGGAGAPEILANPGAYNFSGALPDVSGYATYWDPVTQAFTSAPAGAAAISGPAGIATAAEAAPTTEGLLANFLAGFGGAGEAGAATGAEAGALGAGGGTLAGLAPLGALALPLIPFTLMQMFGSGPAAASPEAYIPRQQEINAWVASGKDIQDWPNPELNGMTQREYEARQFAESYQGPRGMYDWGK